MKNEEPTQKEIEEAKERMREVALKNLTESKLLDLATAYHTNREDSGYGKNDNNAVEEFLYYPAINYGPKTYDLKSGKESDLVKDSLFDSRQDERRYSGQVSEHEIIKTAAAIIEQSLRAIKVDDMTSLAPVYIKKAYKGKYLADLLESEKEEDKEFALKLIGGYMQYQTTKRVSRSLDQRADKIKGGLEKLVKAE